MNGKIKSILVSILVVGVVAAMLGVSTISWLSDEEKSVGNFLVAGSLDLKIDLVNSTHFRHNGTLIEWNSFDEKNLGREDRFFSWKDIKPGDYGEFTISLHLFDNPGYLYFNISNIVDTDNGINEPEDMVDGIVNNNDTTPDGDLDDYVYFYGWIDWGMTPGWQGPNEDPYEGNNVWDCGYPCHEPIIVRGNLSEVKNRSYNVSEAIKEVCANSSGIMQPCKTIYIAIAWWIPGKDIGLGDYDPFHNGVPYPLPGAGNIIQSDMWAADLTFYVEQI